MTTTDSRRGDAPLVSVLMPNYNGQAHLQDAVLSGLAQRYRPMELIVLDDGSTDASMAVLERLAATHRDRMRLLTHEDHTNLGLVATYREALNHARGTIVAFLESDDLWEPDNLERKVEVFRRHPDVGVVHSDFRPIGDRRGCIYWGLFGSLTRATTRKNEPYDALRSLLFRNPVPSYTHFAARRDLLETVPHLPAMHRNCDWWTLAHLSLSARFYFLPERLTSWRIHRDSSHYGPVKVPLRDLRGFLLLLHDSLLRAAPAGMPEADRRSLLGARELAENLDTTMLDGPRTWLASARRQPGISVGALVDTAVRWALFS